MGLACTKPSCSTYIHLLVIQLPAKVTAVVTHPCLSCADATPGACQRHCRAHEHQVWRQQVEEAGRAWRQNLQGPRCIHCTCWSSNHEPHSKLTTPFGLCPGSMSPVLSVTAIRWEGKRKGWGAYTTQPPCCKTHLSWGPYAACMIGNAALPIFNFTACDAKFSPSNTSSLGW